jgi:hypothetical protein
MKPISFARDVLTPRETILPHSRAGEGEEFSSPDHFGE